MSEEDEEAAFRAALEAVAKKFEAKISGALSDISKTRAKLESYITQSMPVDDVFKENIDILLRKSHTLAGSAGQFGHPDLTELARAVEEMCLSIVENEFENPDAFPLLIEFTKELEAYSY